MSPNKLEAGVRTNSAGIPYTLLLRIGALGFPPFELLVLQIRDLETGVDCVHTHAIVIPRKMPRYTRPPARWP